MADIDSMTDEERYAFGSWLYFINEGWKEPDWWDKHDAERYGHVLTVIFTAP